MDVQAQVVSRGQTALRTGAYRLEVIALSTVLIEVGLATPD